MKRIVIILIMIWILVGFTASVEAINEQHEFGSSGSSFCFCGTGRDKSWDSTAINTFNVKYIEVRSELAEPASCPAGGTHYVTIKINDSDVLSCPGQYVDHTFYSYYTCAGDVDFTLNQGDKITYYFTYTDTACIRGPNYVIFADAVPGASGFHPGILLPLLFE